MHIANLTSSTPHLQTNHSIPHMYVIHSYTAAKCPKYPHLYPTPPPLYAKGTHQIQFIEGTLVYLSKIDPFIKPDLNKISSQKSAPTKYTNTKDTMLLDYLSKYPDIVIRQHSSNTVLIYETNAAYLVLPKHHSRSATWFMFGNDPNKTPNQMTNSTIHIMCNTHMNKIRRNIHDQTTNLHHTN